MRGLQPRAQEVKSVSEGDCGSVNGSESGSGEDCDWEDWFES